MNDFLNSVREQSYVLRKDFEHDIARIVIEFNHAAGAIAQGHGTTEHAKTLNDFHEHVATRVREELERAATS